MKSATDKEFNNAVSVIRHANMEDLEEIIAILNQAISKKQYTGRLQPFSAKKGKEWFEAHRPDSYPIFVMETNDRIVGWSSISPYRPGREAFIKSCEISYFINDNYQGQGLGKRLLSHTIGSAQKLSFNAILAIVLHTNIKSISMLEKTGFELWGRMPGVAEINGQSLDHLYLGLKL